MSILIYITADSPIPFNIRKIWYDINREINATYQIADASKQTSENECLVREGNTGKVGTSRV